MGLFVMKMLLLAEHFLGQKLYKKIFGKFQVKCLDKLDHTSVPSSGYSVGSQIHHVGKDIVLYKGLANSWSAVKKWDLEYFEENYGEHKVTIKANPGLYDSSVESSDEELKLSDYLRQLKSGSRKYLKLSDLVHQEQTLKQQLDYNMLQKFKPKFSTGEIYFTFIGGKGTLTPMHNEIPCNIFVQIYGKKRWVLYSPDSFPFLNINAERRQYFHSNEVPDKIDEKNPYFKYASKIEIILEPGDILYVPPFYWHYVENVTDSISVAFKFANLPVAYKSSKFFTLMILMATRPSLISSFIFGRLIKKDYVLVSKN